ncbi:MAG: arylamine N-acetyltransferase family protein [Bradyrhizobium sp.]
MPNEFRLENYLARIGYQGPIGVDLGILAALQTVHLDAIPFESLDPFLGRPVLLDLASVQAKLVEDKRGGYCFEQNLLFKAALEAVGFKVTGLAGRVRWMSPPDSPLGPKTHMMLKVDLAEGAYLADVGFGACLLDAPLQLKTDVEQTTAMGTYRISQSDGLLSLEAKRQAGWRTMYVFDLQPQIQADYELGNWFTSTNPLVPLTSRLIMERLAGDRRSKLVDRAFSTEARDGEVIAERTLRSADELRAILRDTFRVTPPAPAEEIFNKAGG